MRYVVNTITSFDLILFNKIFNRSGRKFIERFFIWITRSGDGHLYPLITGLLFLFGPTDGYKLIFSMSLAFSIDLSLYIFIKRKVKRDRPFAALPGIKHLIQPPDRFSFPSGHTAAAFLVATVLSYYYPLIDGPLYFWAFLVGLSRVYLGVHYPSDVIAGGFLGVLSASLSLVSVDSLIFIPI